MDGQVDMKIDEKTSPYQGDVLRCPVMKKAPLPSLTWKQLNQLLAQKWACCQEPPTPQGKCLEGW